MNMNPDYQSELSATIKFLKEKVNEWEKGIHLLFGSMKEICLQRIKAYKEAIDWLEGEQF
jgi:hypothetical protein